MYLSLLQSKLKECILTKTGCVAIPGIWETNELDINNTFSLIVRYGTDIALRCS